MSQRYVALLDTKTFIRRNVLDRMLLVAVYTSYGLEGGKLPPRPGVGLGGLVPRAASAVSGGLVPHTESDVLGGLSFTSTDYCEFRTHGPQMRIDDLSAPSGGFVARVSASVASVDRWPGRGGLCLQPTLLSLRCSPYPPSSTRAPQKPLLPRRPSPSRLLQGVLYGGLTRSRPRARPHPPLPRLALRCPDGEAVLGPHLHPDTPAYSNSR